MTRPISSTVRQFESDGERKPGFGQEEVQLPFFEVQDLTPGVVTNLPRDKRPLGSFVVAQNARLRRDYVLRRGGWSIYAPTPDGNDVIKVLPFRDEQDVDWIIRIAIGSMHAARTDTGAWLNITGTQFAQNVRMTYAQFPPDRLYVAAPDRTVSYFQLSGDPGLLVEAPQPTGEDLQYSVLPKTSRFVTNFAERIVVAYNTYESGNAAIGSGGVLTTNISWSVPADPDKWNVFDTEVVQEMTFITDEETNITEEMPVYYARDPATGETLDEKTTDPTTLLDSGDEVENEPVTTEVLVPTGAGTENLVTSPSDTGDEITGIIAFEQVMVIFRERSIWHATRQPFAQAPFRFFPVTTEVGCDMPYTIVRVLGGIVWTDFRTRGIYFYRPGIQPIRLNEAIEDENFLSDLVWPEGAEAAYDPVQKEYHVGYPTNELSKLGLSFFWVGNFDGWVENERVPGWTLDTGPGTPFISVVDDVGSQIMIDDLVGFIDDQNPPPTGVIDDYFVVEARDSIVVKGRTFNIYVYDEDYNFDPGIVLTGPEMVLETQDLVHTRGRRTLQEWWSKIEAVDDDFGGVPGSPSTAFEILIDNKAPKNAKSQLVAGLLKAGFKKNFSGDRMRLRITTRAGGFRLYEWWARVVDKSIKHIEGFQ